MKDKYWIATITRSGMSCDLCHHSFKINDKCRVHPKKGITICNECHDKETEKNE